MTHDFLESKTVPLYLAADRERLAELKEAFDSALVASGPQLLGDKDPKQEAASAYDEFVAEATERAVKVRVQAVARKKWRALIAEHPPRKGNETDEAYGFNEETFGDSLVPASVVEPKFDTAAELEEFLDGLSHAQYRQIYTAAFRLNAEVGPSPKSDLRSLLVRISDET